MKFVLLVVWFTILPICFQTTLSEASAITHDKVTGDVEATRTKLDENLLTEAIRFLHKSYSPTKQYYDRNSLGDGRHLMSKPSFKAWKGETDSFALALVTRADDDPNNSGSEFDLELALYSKTQGKLQALATVKLSDPTLVNEAGVISGAELDLAPYDIREHDRAIGVRVSSSFQTTSLSMGETRLYLFQLNGQDLKKVLETSCEQDKSIFLLSTRKSLGYFDVIEKTGSKQWVFKRTQKGIYETTSPPPDFSTSVEKP